MRPSDEVREYCRSHYIEPARERGDATVTIRSGDVHSALGYRNRYPLVVAAIGTQKFEEANGISRLSVEGPLNGASTLFTFAL